MKDNVLMAYHIVPDRNDPNKLALNTNKLYKWQITDKTQGEPMVGKVALVRTRFGWHAPVMVYATKEVANDLSDLNYVIKFTDEEPKSEEVKAAFAALMND